MHIFRCQKCQDRSVLRRNPVLLLRKTTRQIRRINNTLNGAYGDEAKLLRGTINFYLGKVAGFLVPVSLLRANAKTVVLIFASNVNLTRFSVSDEFPVLVSPRFRLKNRRINLRGETRP